VQLPPSVPTREPGGVAPLLATDAGSKTPRWFIDGGANGPASPGQDLPYDPTGLPLSAANAQVIGLVLDGITSPQRWFSDSPRVAYGVAGGLLQDNAKKPTQYGHFAFIVSGDPDGTNLMMTPLASIKGKGAVTAIFSYDATQLFVCIEGPVLDGLGYLNRLSKRAGEFEAMSIEVLGSKHPFQFHAGLLAIGRKESFASVDKRIADFLRLAQDEGNPLRLYWNENEIPKPTKGSIAERIIAEVHRNFLKQG
jgi:hypothetical protein